MPRKSASSLAYPIDAGERLRPPAYLSPEQRTEFIALVGSLPASHFRLSELPLVCAYARAIVAERHAAAKLDAEPVTADGKPSAWLPYWLAKIRAVTTLSRQMHLSPTGRASIKAPKQDGTGLSYYDQMKLERRDEPN